MGRVTDARSSGSLISIIFAEKTHLSPFFIAALRWKATEGRGTLMFVNMVAVLSNHLDSKAKRKMAVFYKGIFFFGGITGKYR